MVAYKQDSSSINLYKQTVSRMLGRNFPTLTEADINAAVDYSINKRYKQEPCTINNSYSNKKVNMNLQEVTDYIMDRQPITTMYGVLWKRKGTVPNPLCKMTKKFMEQRGIYKKEMFKFPKGSEDYERFNLAQLLSKLDSNALLN